MAVITLKGQAKTMVVDGITYITSPVCPALSVDTKQNEGVETLPAAASTASRFDDDGTVVTTVTCSDEVADIVRAFAEKVGMKEA